MRNTIGQGGFVIGAANPRRAGTDLRWMIVPLLLAGVASVSLAAPVGSETSTIRVRYNRTDLTSTAGALKLLRRIGNAALESCGASPFSLAEFKAATEQSRCWRAAVDDAVRSIGSPALTAVVQPGLE